MDAIGKHWQKWLETRRKWIKLNPPNHQGYYICWLCGAWVAEREMELDHIISRTRAPKLRYVLSNLAPSCHPCNKNKGSKTGEPKRDLGREFDIVDQLW